MAGVKTSLPRGSGGRGKEIVSLALYVCGKLELYVESDSTGALIKLWFYRAFTGMITP